MNLQTCRVVVGVEAMDKEQLQLGASDKFWKLITLRRNERPLSRAVLVQKVVTDCKDDSPKNGQPECSRDT